MEGDVDVHRELKIINTDVLVVKPLIDEVIENINIKEWQIIENFSFLLALDKHFQSIISKIFITGKVNGFIFVAKHSKWCQWLSYDLLGQWFLGPFGPRDKSLDCTLDSGGAILRGFLAEAFGEEDGLEAFVFFFFFSLGGEGAASVSASPLECSTAAL